MVAQWLHSGYYHLVTKSSQQHRLFTARIMCRSKSFPQLSSSVTMNLTKLPLTFCSGITFWLTELARFSGKRVFALQHNVAKAFDSTFSGHKVMFTFLTWCLERPETHTICILSKTLTFEWKRTVCKNYQWIIEDRHIDHAQIEFTKFQTWWNQVLNLFKSSAHIMYNSVNKLYRMIFFIEFCVSSFIFSNEFRTCSVFQ